MSARGWGCFCLVGLCLTALTLDASAQDCEYPGVLLVVDRSSSMGAGQIGGQTKWEIARDAIGVMLDGHAQAVDFGLMVYPGPSGLGGNGVEGGVGACRYNQADVGCSPQAPRCSTGEVSVDIGRQSEAPIRAMLEQPVPAHSYTPTWQSLEAAQLYPLLHNPRRRDFVVLITDGWQCCGLYEDEDGVDRCEWENRDLPVDKVVQLRDAGIVTFVVGFGNSVDRDTLDRMALEAGTALPEGQDGAGEALRRYYQADNHAELRELLDGIARRIQEESCDGRDNDCDGQIDEALAMACETPCGAGERSCHHGEWGECSALAPQGEACDGEDDDCDGSVDEGLLRPCNTACGGGEERCEVGFWVACDAPQPREEICDEIDNDCDGSADPGCECLPGATRPCGVAQGRCEIGEQRCGEDGQWQQACEGGVPPVAEECNGLDDDCDGVTDDLRRDCQSACGGGEEQCLEGAWSNCSAPMPGLETCDGVDEDCDGQQDEGIEEGCETVCGLGQRRCELGAWGPCSARQPSAEICGNGIDDDCDDQMDEACECETGAEQPCGTNYGVCEEGSQGCADGRWGECTGGISGAAESCNGLDDDCDGVRDNAAPCPSGRSCLCGDCAGPCIAGECDGAALCIRGYCVVDACPEGSFCDDGGCVEGEAGPGVDPPPGWRDGDDGADAGSDDGGTTGSTSGAGVPDGGCGCRAPVAQPAQAGPGLKLLLLACLGLALSRRARKPRRP